MGRHRISLTIAVYAALAAGAYLCGWKGITLLPFFCVEVVLLRAFCSLAGLRARPLLALYLLVFTYAFFKVSVSFSHLGSAAPMNMARGFAFVPQVAIPAAVVCVVALIILAITRRFKLVYVLDAALFMIFLASSLEVAFQQMPFFQGRVSDDPAIIFSRRERGFHFGVSLAGDGTNPRLYYTQRGDPNKVVTCDIRTGKCLATSVKGENILRTFYDAKNSRLYVSYDGNSGFLAGDKPRTSAFSLFSIDQKAPLSPRLQPHLLRELSIEPSSDFMLSPTFGELVYVSKHNLAVRADPVTGRTIKSCRLKFQPYFMAADRDGKNYYASSLEGLVVELDAKTMCEKRILKLGTPVGDLVFDPNRNLLYAATMRPGGVHVIRLPEFKQERFVKTFYFTRELALLPDADRLIVSDWRLGRVAVLDSRSFKTIKVLSFGKLLRRIDVDSDSRTAAVVSYNGVFVFRIP